jgi:hypothetical protein
MGPIQFAEDITPDIEAINPGKTFSPNIETIYAIYPVSGMEKGLDFTTIWYRNGVELGREETQWEYGSNATSYSYIRLQGTGLYKIELYINDSVLATGLFEIR